MLNPIDFDSMFERAKGPAGAIPAQALLGPSRQNPDRATEVALARRDWALANVERQRALSARGAEIPRIANLSREAFLEDYYAASRPVVITGEMEGWPALDRWTPDYLKGIVGAAPVEFQGERNAAADFELAKDRHKRTLPFDAFIDLIADEDGGNDAYITAYNSAKNPAALAVLDGDLGALDKYLTPAPGMMWIGPAGTFTPLHFDLTNNLLAQVVGTKYLVLLPPSETSKLAHRRHVFSDVHDVTDPDCLARHPEAEAARQFEVELNPGELLYIPIGWWHQVAAASFSVMLTYTNFHWPNDAYASFPGD